MEVEAVAAAATEQAVIAKNALKVAATAAAERADIETNAVSAAAASEVEQASIKKTVEEDERDSKRKRKRNATTQTTTEAIDMMSLSTHPKLRVAPQVVADDLYCIFILE